MSTLPKIDGFLKSPKKTAGDKLYRGLFTCPNVQWTGGTSDLVATFTITAGELADMAQSQLLWTDQDVQRGIQPGVHPKPARELSLATGYPDTAKYIFDAANADDMVEKLLANEKLFLNSLIWNLRPGKFEAYWDKKAGDLYLYSGHIFLPDSHHRHQAIIKAVRTWREAPKDFPKFSDQKEFKVELYFLAREDEGNYFFDKNQRPKPTAKSKAYDLTTLDDLSLLAKKAIEKSKHLSENVNRVTDRLSQRNPQALTLSTLREMMRGFASSEQLDPSELEGLALIAANFYDLLATVRPELGVMDLSNRRRIRDAYVVDAAVMMHGYAALMRDYNADLATLGPSSAKSQWTQKLAALSHTKTYAMNGWTGDLFEKRNPLWQAVGVVKPSKSGSGLTVLNTGGARAQCARVLRQLLAIEGGTTDLNFLAR